MKKQNFCCVDNLSVLIPYRDLEKLLEVGNKIEQIESSSRRMEQMYGAMRTQYVELLQKVAEIEKYL